MSDEKIIMDKEDYHEILNVCKRIKMFNTNELEDQEAVSEIKDLLDKAEPYEVT